MLRTGTSLCSNEVLYSWTVFERHWRETQTFWTYTSIPRLVDVLHCCLFIWHIGCQGRLQDYIRGGGEEGKQGERGSGCSEWFFHAPFYSKEGKFCTKLKFATKKIFCNFYIFLGWWILSQAARMVTKNRAQVNWKLNNIINLHY